MITHFEKSDFFDSCVTKEMFFLTLHDAVLAALGRHQKPDELEPPAEEFPEEPLAEQQKVECLLNYPVSKVNFVMRLRKQGRADALLNSGFSQVLALLQWINNPLCLLECRAPFWGKASLCAGWRDIQLSFVARNDCCI